MEDMKGDMAGAACVVGLMHALAARKAKVNAVGAIGLVENMPDGNAQRPGDIVTSMSGQTIEIINTDAEGRLVLADVLWYVAKQVQAEIHGRSGDADRRDHGGARPGICRPVLQRRRARASGCTAAGQETGERVWRMPLGPEYDKLIDSQVRRHEEHRRPLWRLDHRGAVPAALRREDAVGASRHRRHRHGASPPADINRSWGSGLGVRLLDQLVAEHYEVNEMTEVLFYHLAEHDARERCCRQLLERSLERGWRVVVQALVGRSASTRSTRICGPIATILSCRTAHRAIAIVPIIRF